MAGFMGKTIRRIHDKNRLNAKKWVFVQKEKIMKLKIEIEFFFFAPGFLLMRQFAVLKGFRIEFQF
jgi:hypothetical protein